MNSLADILNLLMRSVSGEEGSSRLEVWIRRHRLEPLIYGVELPEWNFRATFMDECRQAYFNMIGRAELFSKETIRLIEQLSARGISTYAWRGVVHGRELYGDAALRYCTDVDLMVTPGQKWDALKVLTSNGYRLRSGVLPKWYLARHHLHWPLISADGRVPVDVHWAVDHPYQHVGREVSVSIMAHDKVSRCIMAMHHAEKESRFRFCTSAEQMKHRLLESGPILTWLDLSLMLNQLTSDQLAGVIEKMSSEPWSGMRDRSLRICREVFGVETGTAKLSEPVFSKTGKSSFIHRLSSCSWMQKWAEKIGCRPDVLSDWFDYLGADSHKVTGWEKGCDLVGRIFNVMILFCDTVVCGIWLLIVKRRKVSPA